MYIKLSPGGLKIVIYFRPTKFYCRAKAHDILSSLTPVLRLGL